MIGQTEYTNSGCCREHCHANATAEVAQAVRCYARANTVPKLMIAAAVVAVAATLVNTKDSGAYHSFAHYISKDSTT
jgi:hypothetical protein